MDCYFIERSIRIYSTVMGDILKNTTKNSTWISSSLIVLYCKITYKESQKVTILWNSNEKYEVLETLDILQKRHKKTGEQITKRSCVMVLDYADHLSNFPVDPFAESSHTLFHVGWSAQRSSCTRLQQLDWQKMTYSCSSYTTIKSSMQKGD